MIVVFSLSRVRTRNRKSMRHSVAQGISLLLPPWAFPIIYLLETVFYFATGRRVCNLWGGGW